MPKSTLDVTHRVWWSWIPIVGALVSSNETRKRRKEEKEKEEESKDKKLNNVKITVANFSYCYFLFGSDVYEGKDTFG